MANSWIGQTVDGYLIESILGRGNMGIVYRIRHIETNETKALKCISSDPNWDAERRRKEIDSFLIEAETVIGFHHPNIIKVYSVGKFSIDEPYIIMEECLGSFKDAKQLSILEVAIYISQVASALQYAHDRGMVHRDVIPANILFGADGRLRISDFGIVTQTTSGSLTERESIGSPEYMAPEQILKKPVRASDQYALAVIAYQLLTGKLPFSGDVMQVLHAHLHTDAPRMRDIVINIPPKVEEIILRALRKDPKRRFKTVRAFADALLHEAAFSIPSVTQRFTDLYAVLNRKEEILEQVGGQLEETQEALKKMTEEKKLLAHLLAEQVENLDYMIEEREQLNYATTWIDHDRLRDQTLYCYDCEQDFTFMIIEQLASASRGITAAPRYCIKCRHRHQE